MHEADGALPDRTGEQPVTGARKHMVGGTDLTREYGSSGGRKQDIIGATHQEAGHAAQRRRIDAAPCDVEHGGGALRRQCRPDQLSCRRRETREQEPSGMARGRCDASAEDQRW